MSKLEISTAIVLLVLILLVIPGASATTIDNLTITVYKNGKVLHDATVELWTNNSLIARGITNSNGTVIFRNISTGNYTIYVYYNGSAWRFNKEVGINTTSITLNITDDTIEYSIGLEKPWSPTRITGNPLLLYTGIGVLLIILLLLAYAFSGKKIPHRR